MKKTILYTIMCCFLFQFVQGQGVLKIENSTYLNASGTVYIKIDNADLNAQGTFSPSASTVEMTGNNNTTPGKIIGSSSVSFNNLKINRSMQNVRLDQDISVNGTLDFLSGNLNLNGKNLTLNGASISGENESNRIITSSTGDVIITTNLNSPNQSNPGNMGAIITSNSNLGSTIIKRGHTVQTNAGGMSIERYFDITPTNNSGLDATLRFEYIEAELNGIPENELEFWRKEGANWSYQGYTTRNSGANYVELIGIDAFSLWTVTNQANALPVELIDFSATPKNQKIHLQWRTASEVNHDYFEVEKASNGIGFYALSKVDGVGGLDRINHYEAIDNQPIKGVNYYRLKMVDLDGSFDYSNIVSVDVKGGVDIKISPNPTTGKLGIFGQELVGSNIQILDSNGRLVRSLTFLGQEFDISDLSKGLYFILINTEGRIFKTKIVKE